MKSTVSLLSLTICLCLLVGYNFMSASWTTAPANPPANNVDAPINIGATTQTKNGNLIANTLAAATSTWSPRYCNALGSHCMTNSSVGTWGLWTMGGSLTVQGTTTATAFMYSSDRRLKSNIETISDPIELVKKLRGVTFDWNTDGTHTHGLIAQEVELVLPELVGTDSDGYKSVAYGNLIPILIEAIKQQQAEIELLKSQSE